MRGKQITLSFSGSGFRLIPAYAGKTLEREGHEGGCRAHPRVYGENNALPLIDSCATGSSPRMRGKPAR